VAKVRGVHQGMNYLKMAVVGMQRILTMILTARFVLFYLDNLNSVKSQHRWISTAVWNVHNFRMLKSVRLMCYLKVEFLKWYFNTCMWKFCCIQYYLVLQLSWQRREFQWHQFSHVSVERLLHLILHQKTEQTNIELEIVALVTMMNMLQITNRELILFNYIIVFRQVKTVLLKHTPGKTIMLLWTNK